MSEIIQWLDSEDIGIRLFELHPDVKPLETRFTDMHKMVCDIPEFDDDPKASNEKILEAIQMAWLEEWEDGQE